MSELGGAVQGVMAAQQYNFNADDHTLAMAEGGMKLESENIANQGAQMQLDQQRKFMQAITQMISGKGGTTGQGTPASAIAGQLDQYAELAMSAGLPDQASKYAHTSSVMRENESKIQDRLYKQSVQNLGHVASLMDGVTDQASWDQAKDNFQFATGQQVPPQIAAQPYSPRLKQQVIDMATSMKDRAQIGKDTAQGAAAAAQAKLAPVRQDLMEQQISLAAARERHLDKVGGQDKLPTDGQVKAITDQVSQDYSVDSTNMPSVRALSRSVAENAKKIQAANPGMDPSDVYKQAYRKAKDSGTFGGLEPLKGLPGTNNRNPMTMPMAQGKLNTQALKDNMYYKGPDGSPYAGKVYRYNAATKGFLPVNPQAGAAPAGGAAAVAADTGASGDEAGDETEDDEEEAMEP